MTTAAVTAPAVRTTPAVSRSQPGGRHGRRVGPPSNSSAMRLVVRRTHGLRGGLGVAGGVVDGSSSNLYRRAAVRFAVEEVPFHDDAGPPVDWRVATATRHAREPYQ